MQNRIWQAEEEKWERRRKRAERVLTHIRELRQLEAEEEAEDAQGNGAAGQVAAAAGQVVAAAGQVVAAAGQAETPAGPTAAPVPPLPVKEPNERSESKKPARDAVPELLSKGPLTTRMMADALNLSAQAIANALNELAAQDIVVQEKSTFPGFRFQYRLVTPQEREASRSNITGKLVKEVEDDKPS